MKSTPLSYLFISMLFLQMNFDSAFAQSTSKMYNRNSMSFVLISHPNDNYDELIKEFYTAIDKGDKYNMNSIELTILEANFDRDAVISFDQKANKIAEALNDENVAKQIISVWFNRKEDGTMNMERIHERGLYNAGTTDFQIAKTQQVDINLLKDRGKELVKNSYVVAFDIRELRDIIDQNTAILTWYGTIDSYLFEIDNSDAIVEEVFNTWIDDETSGTEIEQANERYDAMEFKIKPVLYTSTAVQPPMNTALVMAGLSAMNSTSKNKPVYTGDKVAEFKQFVERSYPQAMLSLENVRPDFKVRTLLKSVHPLTAEIGTKEGVYKKQLFNVYEMRYNELTQQTAPYKVASIRATKVGKNSQVSSGIVPVSKFMVVHRKNPIQEGMFIEQDGNDKRAGLTVEYAGGNGIGMYSLGVEALSFATASSFSGYVLLDFLVATYDRNVTTTTYDYNYYYGYIEESTTEIKTNLSLCFRLGYGFGFNLIHPNIKVKVYGIGGLGLATEGADNTTYDEYGNSEVKFNEATYSIGVTLGYKFSPGFELYYKTEKVKFTNADGTVSGLGMKFNF